MTKSKKELIGNLNNYENEIQKWFPNNKVDGLDVRYESWNIMDKNPAYELFYELSIECEKNILLSVEINYFAPNDSTFMKAGYINPISNRTNYVANSYPIKHWASKGTNLNSALNHLKKELTKRKLIK